MVAAPLLVSSSGWACAAIWRGPLRVCRSWLTRTPPRRPRPLGGHGLPPGQSQSRAADRAAGGRVARPASPRAPAWQAGAGQPRAGQPRAGPAAGGQMSATAVPADRYGPPALRWLTSALLLLDRLVVDRLVVDRLQPARPARAATPASPRDRQQLGRRPVIDSVPMGDHGHPGAEGDEEECG